MVWEDEEDTYFNCPSEFIPDTVSDWFRQFQYEKEFGTNVSYGERSIKFLKALSVYRYWLDEYKPRPKTMDGFAKVRQSWQKK